MSLLIFIFVKEKRGALSKATGWRPSLRISPRFNSQVALGPVRILV